MTELPTNVSLFKATPAFSHETVPEGLLNRHRTGEGVWGKIVVLEGTLEYRILEPAPKFILLSPARPGLIEPLVHHEVRTVGPVRFFVEFYKAQAL